MQKFMENSKVHLVKLFFLVKKKYEQKHKYILCKTEFFTDSVSSVGVLKLAITTINCVKCLHEAGGKTNICIGYYLWHIMTSPLQF